jgi:predicted nucleic acid-binding protein
MAFSGDFRILATPALFLEYEEVLGRDEQRDVHRMSSDRVKVFLIGLAAIIEPVKVYYQWRPQLRDTDDEMVLETALNGRADAIATHNLRDFIPVARKFNVRVLSPGDLVREVLR